MPLSQTVGAMFRMLVDTALPFDGASVNLEVMSEAVEVTEELINPDAMRGSRTRRGTKTRRGRVFVSGPITIPATPASLAIILQGSLGAAPSSGVYNTAETLPEYQILLDDGDQIRHLENCVFNVLEVVSSPGQAMMLTVSIEAEDVNDGQSWPGSPPAIADDTLFIHSDFADAEIGSTEFQHHSLSISVNNFVTTDEFANSLTRAERLLPQDREVSGSLEVDPTTENAALIAGNVADGLTLEAVAGTWTLTLEFGMCQFGKQKPVTAGKGPRKLGIPFVSRASASLPDIRATLLSS